MTDYAQVLAVKYSGKSWSIQDNDYSSLVWNDSGLKPSQSVLDSLWAEVEYELEMNRVRFARHAAYVAPDGSDAVFMKFQRGEASEQDWLDAVQAINDALPYPVKGGK